MRWRWRAIGGALTMVFCLGGHAQGDFILTDKPQLARARGGCLEVGHRVLGVSWGELSWSRWSLSEGPKPMEWARGLSFEGGQRWSRVQGFWGGMRQWQDGHGMFKIAAGWTSWPAVEVRAPWLEGRLSASRDAPWGNLRMEAMWTLGQRTSMAGSNDGVSRAELPWGWTAWWTPNMDGSVMGMPALGWSQDGQWAIAWNAQVKWAEAMRFWRPPPGRIHLHWRLPTHVFELSWKGSLGASTESQGPTTSSRGNTFTGPKHALGCATRQGQSLPGWRAFWMWEREGNSSEEP
ncbi:MAG: hypothetical protein ACPF87_03150 [Flavobacteriales bacterium]